MDCFKENILLLFIWLALISCNKSVGNFGGSPYMQGCKINAEGGGLNSYDLSEYFKNIKSEISSTIPLSNDLNEILLTETIDGGNGIFDLKIILFNDHELIPINIEYEFIDGKAVTKELYLCEMTHKDHLKIIEINNKIKDNGVWNLFIDCIGFAQEQQVIFYLKEKQRYHYYAKFQNFYFSKNSNIGITKDVLFLVKKMEELKK